MSAALVANAMGAATAKLRSSGSFTTASATRSAVVPEKKNNGKKKKKKKKKKNVNREGEEERESHVSATDPYSLRTPSPLPRPRSSQHERAADETCADSLEA